MAIGYAAVTAIAVDTVLTLVFECLWCCAVLSSAAFASLHWICNLVRSDQMFLGLVLPISSSAPGGAAGLELFSRGSVA